MNIREWKLSLLGTGTRTVRLEIAGYQGVFDRRFAGQQSLPEFVGGLDALMQQGQVLKDDRTSFVSRVFWSGHDMVVKRYNHRNLWHSLRHTIKGSRARRTWLSAHHLLSLKIATPEPLAYVDLYRGHLLWQSYFVTRFVPGPPVQEILRDETIVPAQKQRVSDLVLELLHRMAEHGVSHGDMKHTNILYDGTNVVLTDLDAMRSGGAGWLCRHRYRRDVDRYLRDVRLQEQDAISATPVAPSADLVQGRQKGIHMQEPQNAIYLVTGVNEPYLSRAIPYLETMNRYSNVQNVVITLDFQIPSEYVARYPRIRFLPISSSQIASPNPNSCMQHGGFLPALSFLKETDIIIYTDADIELQRPLSPAEIELLRGFQDDDVGVGYNESKDDRLSLEALKLKPTIAPEELSARYPGIDTLLTYNTGVLVANARTYGRLYEMYNQHWPDFAPVFDHYAKQQWLLSYLVNRHFRPRVLASTFHTHGHRPVALRVTDDSGYKFCVGSELVLFSHGMFHEARRTERRVRDLQKRVWKWRAVSAVLALVCVLLVLMGLT